MTRASILRTIVASLAVTASLVASLAVTASPGEPQPPSAPPADAAAIPNPLAATPDIVGGGQKLFRRHCAECHGPHGTGLLSAANLTSRAVQDLRDGELFWYVTNGKPGTRMPSFSRLPEPQRWQIVAFLRTLRAPQ